MLATSYVPLVDIEEAPRIVEGALRLRSKGLIIRSRRPLEHSPSHRGLEPLWSIAEEAGVAILFRLGGETKMKRAYHNNGLPQVLDFHGGARILRFPVLLAFRCHCGEPVYANI